MEDEPILIMDEPMNGLDRAGIKNIRELILKEKEKGKIILLASHNSADIEYLCDEVYEMENGKIISCINGLKYKSIQLKKLDALSSF